jgi:hypothetical protein
MIRTTSFAEKRMPLFNPTRDRRSGTLSPRSLALLFAFAVAIAGSCAAGVAATPDDKAKPAAETPSKATDGSVTAAPSAPGAGTGTSVTITGTFPDAKTDSDTPPPTKKSRKRAHIQIGDDDFENFNDALHTAPWVIGLAFLVAGSVLLTPVFLLIGIIWYKLRKTRMQNEAMLQLAERGVVPPAQAVDAMMSGASPEAAAAAASPSAAASAAAPVYQQAVIARRRAVWSDLRRGVIFIAVGLSFVFYSLFDSGSANWVGLVLLFLGVGYTLLWWFEDRHLQNRESSVGVDVGKP